MHYMLINVTRTDLSAEQYAELGKRAQAFYDNVPDGVRLLGDWLATDGSRSFALLETDDQRLLQGIQAPFAGLVDIEVVPVAPISGWDSS